MKRLKTDKPRFRHRRAFHTAVGSAIVLILLGYFGTDQLNDFLGYALIVAGAVLPTALWIVAGARGIPIIPVLALGHIVYFALPILRGTPAEIGYDDEEALRAAITVSLFLVIASAASHAIAMGARRVEQTNADLAERTELHQLMFGGLVVGALYQVAVLASAFDGLGYYFGVVRAVTLTLAMASCYLFGVSFGRRQLAGGALVAAIAGLLANVILSWMSLFLVGGAFFLLSAMLGYAISAARVPLMAATIAVVAVGILHAGKPVMRDKYWDERSNYSDYSSLPSPPVLMAEWIAAGVTSIYSGDVGRDISQRASLVWILLHVQRVAPIPIDFLHGETYLLLPQMLVPRFLDPGKIPSQAGMNLLNVHFNILSEEDTQRTAVGWGPIAEGYGNFGYFGVAGAALAIGLLGGALTRWSAGAPAVSLPALFAVAAMLLMANLEADMASLLTALMQSLAGVVIYFGVFRLLTHHKHSRVKATSGPGVATDK